jgi:hypothetical protein
MRWKEENFAYLGYYHWLKRLREIGETSGRTEEQVNRPRFELDTFGIQVEKITT